MGNLCSKVFDCGGKEKRVLMVGLVGAGKTTIMYRLKLGDEFDAKNIPSIAFGNVETFEYKGMSFTCWDLGGDDKIRRLWRHYYPNTHGIVFVIDSIMIII